MVSRAKKYKKVRNFRWEKKGIDKVQKNQPMLNSNILANWNDAL